MKSKIQMVLIGLMLLVGCEGESTTDLEYLEKAKTFNEAGNTKAAEIELKNALRQNPNNTEARWLLGDIYLTAGDAEGAEKELKKALFLGVPKASIVESLTKSLLMQKKFDEALELIGDGSSYSGDLASKMSIVKGWALLGMDKLKEAKVSFQESVTATNNDGLLGLSRLAFINRDLISAEQNIDKLLVTNKMDVNAWMLLAEISVAQGKLEKADLNYTLAIELEPKNVNALLGRASLRLGQSQLNEAEEDINKIIKMKKADIAGNNLKGMLAFRRGEYDDALAFFQKVEKLRPDFLPAKFWLALTYVSLHQYESASSYVKRFLSANPAYLPALKLSAHISLKLSQVGAAIKVLESISEQSDAELLDMLGAAYALSGDLNKSVRFFSQAVAQEDVETEVLIKYSLVLSQQNQPNQAIEILQKALESDSVNQNAALSLVKQMMSNKQFSQAEELLAQVLINEPKNPDALNLQGAFELAKSNRVKAKKIFLSALDVEPGFPAASHNLALLAIRDENIEKARNYYLGVLKENKGHEATRMALFFLDRKNNSPQPEQWLKKILKAKPGGVAASILLARQHLEKGEVSQSIEISSRALNDGMANNTLLELLGVAQLTSGQHQLALTTFKRLQLQAPKSSAAQLYLAKVYTVLGDVGNTKRALSQTLLLGPERVEARIALARIQLVNGEISNVKKHIKKLSLGDNAKSHDAADLLKYDLALVERRYSDAVSLIKSLIKRGKPNSKLMRKMLQAQWQAGEKKQAIKTSNDWLEMHSSDLAVLSFLAQAYENNNNIKLADATYEKILSVNPNNVVALNNLAWIKKNSDAEKAKQLARKAYKINKTAAVVHTYAVIELEMGNTKMALKLLREALMLEKNNPTLKYYLAVALNEAGKIGMARDELNEVLESNIRFPERKDAENLFAKIR